MILLIHDKTTSDKALPKIPIAKSKTIYKNILQLLTEFLEIL